MSALSKKAGAPVWMEYVAADADGAVAFYSAALSLAFAEPQEAFGGYRLIQHADGGIGGLMPARPGTGDTGWIVYLLAPDADDSVRDAREAGATVLFGPMAAGDVGRWAMLQDPSGARVGLFEPWSSPGIEVEGQPGSPGWYELHTTSAYAETVAFYELGLGWPVSVMGDSDEFRMVTYDSGPDAVAGIYDGSVSEAGRPSGWQVYFVVADADAAAGAITAAGGTVLDGPVATPFGRLGHALDPQGALFAFFTPPAG